MKEETRKYELMSEEELREFVKRYRWTFAKTYAAFAPHEYYVKGKLDSKGQKDFERFVYYIRTKGWDAYFGRNLPKNHQLYIELDGHYYWTMGSPIEETIILNRSNAADYTIMEDMKIVYTGGRKKQE